MPVEGPGDGAMGTLGGRGGGGCDEGCVGFSEGCMGAGSCDRGWLGCWSCMRSCCICCCMICWAAYMCCAASGVVIWHCLQTADELEPPGMQGWVGGWGGRTGMGGGSLRERG